MRYPLLLGLLVLAACSRPADDAAPVSADAAPTPPVVDAWPGKYWGDGLRVTISGSPGAHRVMLMTARDGCDGDIGVSDGGVAAKDVGAEGLSIVVAEDAQQVCTITLRRDGNKVTSQEDAGCAALHGAFCSFNGTAERVK